MTQIQLSATLISEIARTLKSAREAKKEDLNDIAYRIALSPSQLRAIESENTAPFYSHHYFLQAAQRYAEALKITLPTDSAQLPAQLPAQAAPPAADKTATEPAPAPSPTQAPTRPPSLAPTQRPIAHPAAIAAELSATTASAFDPPAPLAAKRHRPDSTSVPLVTDAPPKQQRHPVVEKKPLRWAWVGLASLIAILLGVIKISLQESPQILEAQAPAQVGLAKNAAPTAATNAAPTAAPTAATNAAPTAAPTAPVTASPPTAAAEPSTRVFVNGETDSYVRSKAATWLQIVAINGEKTNLRIGPDEQIDFNAAKTAAVVFGRPDAASVYVRGNRINLEPFIEDPDRRRALVIMREVR